MSPSRRTWIILLPLVFAQVAGAQEKLWVRQEGTITDDRTAAAAPDGVGGVYLCGSSDSNPAPTYHGPRDPWLSRYDGAGNRLWIRQFGTSLDEEATAVAPDGSGGVFVSGNYTPVPVLTLTDVWLARYDDVGNQLWMLQFGSSADVDLVHGSAPDGSGGVYIVGETGGNLGGPQAGNRDAWLAHYDGAGNRLWIRQLGTASYDIAFAAAADGLGGVYVSGDSQGSLGGPNAGLDDAWLAHYDSAGNPLWVRQLGTNANDHAEAAAPDGSGGVYVGGHTQGSLGGPNAGLDDAWLTHYDSAGNQLWTLQLGTVFLELLHAAAPDGAGGVYVAGFAMGPLAGPGTFDAWFARYDGEGNQLWIRQLGTTSGDDAWAAAADGSGGLYVGGVTGGALAGPDAVYSDTWVARYAGELGGRYCTPAIPNSTGSPGAITVTGSSAVIDNDLSLSAGQLPPGQFGYFIAGQTQGMSMPMGSQGILCLSGNIGRYNQLANIFQGPAGLIVLDLASIPVNPPQAVLPGDTWNFQCWYRDNNPTLTSNFTDAVSITFM